MAEDVDVHIDDRLIISALNTPGGGVFEWRDNTARKIIDVAIAASPINNPLNAVHRGGVVGTFKASWGFDRRGSNGHRVQATIYNGADHAEFVEFGRSPSSEYQRFSWTVWGGEIRSVGGRGTRGRVGDGTAGRDGKHVLRNATNAVMPGETGGTYTPLA